MMIIKITYCILIYVILYSVIDGAEVVWGPGCSFSETYCENGGRFNMSNCIQLQPNWACGNAAPDSGDPDVIGWWQQANCTCPPGWRGTACQLAEPVEGGKNKCPKDRPIFDGSMVNINNPNKSMECFLDFTKSNFDYSLHHHRIDVKAMIDRTGHGSMYFRMGSRHRMKTTPGQLHNYCEQYAPDIECNMGDCYAESYEGRYESKYTCNQLTCKSCGFPPNTPIFDGNCSDTLGKIVFFFRPPIVLDFKNIDIYAGAADLQLITTITSLNINCRAGMCVDTYINQNYQLTAQQQHEWIAKALIASCGGVLILILIFSIAACIPTAGIKAEHQTLMDETVVSMIDGLRSLPQFGIAFKDITYTVPENEQCVQCCTCGNNNNNSVGREILHGFDGILAPGTMTGILGTSGAGKSSLLDILSNRNKPGWTTGYINYYSEHTNCRRPDDILSYVLQEDILMSTQTVREALMFTAKMRLPPSFSHFMVKAKVERIMRDFCIDHIADSKIGSPDIGGGISGGERKRLAIGLELLVDPRILILDEPTSGLDSHSTNIVMNVLKRAANDGVCVLMTIHQPPSQVFNMFDQVLVITRTGQQAYLGPPKRALDHMIRLGYSQSNRRVNPAEFLLEIVSQDDDDELERISSNFMCSAFMERVREDVNKIRYRDQYDYEGGIYDPSSVTSRMRFYGRQWCIYIRNIVSGTTHKRNDDDDDDNNNDDEKSFSKGKTESLLTVQDALPRRVSHGPTLHRDESISSIKGMVADHRHLASEIDSLPRGSPPAMSADNMSFMSSPATPLRVSSMEENVNDEYYYTNNDDDDDGDRSSLLILDSDDKSSSSPPAMMQHMITSGGYDAYIDNGSKYFKSDDDTIPIFKRPKTSIIMQTVYLMIRQFRHIIRNPMLLLLQYTLTIAVAVLIGFLYWKLDTNIYGAQNRIGAFFFIIAFFTLMSLTSIGDLVNERDLFERERYAQYYGTLPYFVCKIFCDIIPLRVLPAAGFCLICYHMMGLADDALLWANFTIIIIIVNVVATAASFLISSLSTNVASANLAATLYFMFALLFTGLFLNNASTTSFMVILQWGSFARYAWEALVVNEFAGRLFVFNPLDAGISPQLINGDVYIDNFGLKLNTVIPNMRILAYFFVAKFVLTYIIVRFVPRHCSIIKFDLSIMMDVIPCFNCGHQRRRRRRGFDEDDEDSIILATKRKQQQAPRSNDSTDKHASLGIIFENVHYTVGSSLVGKREILRGVSGYARIGHLIGLLGPSGAGKSSLLDILAYRTKSGVVDGDCVFLHEGKQLLKPGSLISYVPQHDVLMATQTVREVLVFSANMRLESTTTTQEINARVSKILEDLCIKHIADTFIGSASDANAGISGGERKRVAIGIELIANPRVLILDEPTSGLDSKSCEVVMNVLRSLTYNGCIVILSIHQPASNIYTLFDHVMVMSRLGQQLYFGPPMQAPEFLRHNGYRLPRQWINPAEFLLDIASSTDDRELQRVSEAYFESKIFRRVYDRMKKLHNSVLNGSHYQLNSGGDTTNGHSATGDIKDINVHLPPSESPTILTVIENGNNNNNNISTRNDYRRGCLYKTLLLMQRSLMNLLRDPGLLLSQLVVTSFFGVLIGLIFYQVDRRIPGLQNRTGVLFFNCIYFALTAWSSLPVLIEGRILFFRERAAKIYGTLPYFVSKVLMDFIPLRVLPAIIYACITYFMIGFRHSMYHFLMYVLLTVGVSITASAACFMFSSLVDTIGQANLLATVFFSFNIIYGGLLLNNATATNHSLMKLRWGSYMHYGYEAYMVNEFHGQENFWFNARGFGKNGKEISGDVWLSNFGLVPSHFTIDLIILGAQLILFLFTTFWALLLKRYIM